jgi:hypothetical protein
VPQEVLEVRRYALLSASTTEKVLQSSTSLKGSTVSLRGLRLRRENRSWEKYREDARGRRRM